jgi:NADH-quinone oxidoreductase subunit M
VIAVVAASGVIFAVYYMLPMVQRIFYNALDKKENREMVDLNGREIAILAPMCALMIWIGFQPGPFLERMEPSVQAVLERVENAPAPAATAEQVPVVEYALDEETSEGVADGASALEEDDDGLSHGDQE